jgi:hypothetical protein
VKSLREEGGTSGSLILNKEIWLWQIRMIAISQRQESWIKQEMSKKKKILISDGG